jgi:hypothetical protein
VLVVFLIIGAFITYWIIRKAVFGGMRDFEVWKLDRDAEVDEQQ